MNDALFKCRASILPVCILLLHNQHFLPMQPEVLSQCHLVIRAHSMKSLTLYKWLDYETILHRDILTLNHMYLQT